MGKHERAAIQALEEAVVAELNGIRTKLPGSNAWSPHLRSIVGRVRADYPGLVEAIHVGNEYGEVGDVRVVSEGEPDAYLELKLSGTATGKGTLANITQDAVAKYGLVEGAIPWSEWRRRREFDRTIVSILDQYLPARSVEGKEAKGRLVKAAADGGNAQAQEVREKCVGYATRDKLAYLRSIRDKPTNPTRIKLFVYSMLSGFHTAKQVRRVLGQTPIEALQDRSRHLVTYYSNLDEGRIVVRREEGGRMADLFKEIGAFELSIPPLEKHKVTASIRGWSGDGWAELLTLVHHWKNVFQGIKTPCINVFQGRFFQDQGTRNLPQ